MIKRPSKRRIKARLRIGRWVDLQHICEHKIEKPAGMCFERNILSERVRRTS